MEGAIFKYNSSEGIGLILGEDGYIYRFKDDFFTHNIKGFIEPMTSVEFQPDLNNRAAISCQIIDEIDVHSYIIPDEHIILRNNQPIWNYYEIADVNLSKTETFTKETMYQRLSEEENDAKLKFNYSNATINFRADHIHFRDINIFRTKGQPAFVGLKSVLGHRTKKNLRVKEEHYDKRLQTDKFLTQFLLAICVIPGLINFELDVKNIIGLFFAIIITSSLFWVLFKSRSIDFNAVFRSKLYNKRLKVDSFEIPLSDIIPYTRVEQKDIYLNGGLFLYDKRDDIRIIYQENENVDYKFAICIKDEHLVNDYLNRIYQHTSIDSFYKCKKSEYLYYPIINDKKQLESMSQLADNYSNTIANDYMNDLRQVFNPVNKASICYYLSFLLLCIHHLGINVITILLVCLFGFLCFTKRDLLDDTENKVLHFTVNKTKAFNIIKT